MKQIEQDLRWSNDIRTRTLTSSTQLCLSSTQPWGLWPPLTSISKQQLIHSSRAERLAAGDALRLRIRSSKRHMDMTLYVEKTWYANKIYCFLYYWYLHDCAWTFILVLLRLYLPTHPSSCATKLLIYRAWDTCSATLRHLRTTTSLGKSGPLLVCNCSRPGLDFKLVLSSCSIVKSILVCHFCLTRAVL